MGENPSIPKMVINDLLFSISFSIDLKEHDFNSHFLRKKYKHIGTPLLKYKYFCIINKK